MLTPFKTILEKRVRGYSFWPEILSLKVLEAWQKEAARTLGQEILKDCQPKLFRAGELVVVVKNPVLSQELRLSEQDIKEKINTSLKQPVLKRIIYKAG